MNINELLEIAEEFFDNMHPNFCEDYVEQNEESELWKLCEDFFSQMGQQV
jgi:ferritin